MVARDYLRLARPQHWIKNSIVLMPLFFALRMNDVQSWIQGVAATVAFCFASSFAYILNDIKDADSDRQHPNKKHRPIACGVVSAKNAMAFAVTLLTVTALIATALSTVVFFIVAVYVLLQICYSVYLKHIPLIDVICIAMGFVLRAACGAAAIRVEISPWLFICMFTICLFMGFCKRYNEMITLGDTISAGSHRRTLIHYTPDLLTHLVTVSAGIAVVAFLLYGLSDRTIEHLGSDYLVYTLPVVVYGVFRFAMLSMKGSYSDPTDLILHDRPFQVTIVIWLVVAFAIVCGGKDLQAWIQNLY